MPAVSRKLTLIAALVWLVPVPLWSRAPLRTCADRARCRVDVGDDLRLSTRWTHAHHWRDLDTLHLRLVDDDGAVLAWVRYTEASNELALCRAEADCDRGVRVGSPVMLESGPWAVLDVGQSRVQGSGPEGSSVDVTLVFRFKPDAGGGTYRMETLAVDDEGTHHLPMSRGSLTVTPRGT
ncbi:MAG: hypothetical protein AB2A00_21390 [Myxococcota bacterium]